MVDFPLGIFGTEICNVPIFFCRGALQLFNTDFCDSFLFADLLETEFLVAPSSFG